MGIIQKQSIRSSIFITFGFALGALNILVLAPKMISVELLGLTRIITDVGLTMASFSTLGSIPVIYKFFPFYKSYLPAKKNDLAFITLIACLAGFAITCLIGYLAHDMIVRKYSGRSPLFVEYYYLVFPFCLFLLLYTWLESFSWSLKRPVTSNILKEILPRVTLTVLLILFFCKLINLKPFLWLFSIAYALPLVILYFILKGTGEFAVHPGISTVTYRLKGKMVNFGLFIFGAQFLNLLSKTSDTIIIASKSEKGLVDTAVFTIATYIVTLMEVPQRSLQSIAVPVLAESWRNKDMKNIAHVYSRSVSNLLVVGLGMFFLIWLNLNNIVTFVGKDYAGIEKVVLFLGLAKVIDLGTGANAQIIGTSSYWRVDFITNVIYTFLAIPLNFILITHFGLMGAAYSAIVTQVIYNLMRYGFLWYKFSLQPYTWKHLLMVVLTSLIGIGVYYIPAHPSFIIDALIRSFVFCIAFIPVMYALNISDEMNQLFNKYLAKLYKPRS